MIKKSFPIYYEGKRMLWPTGVAVWGAGGFVFLSGTEGQTKAKWVIEEGMAEQTRLSLQKLKDRLEDFGTSLENICHLWIYIVAKEFPDGIGGDPNFPEATKVIGEFWQKHAPELTFKRNPPPSSLIGVSGLACKGQLIEIVAIAALPPLT